MSDGPPSSLLGERLVEASAADLPGLIRGADEAELDAAIADLGSRREPAAAAALGAIDALASDRSLRKAARRALHHLRAVGIEAPPFEIVAPPEAGGRGAPEHLGPGEAWATAFDPSGTRAIWLLSERPLGGAWLATAILNDLEGLQDLDLTSTTRKRVLRDVEQWRSAEDVTWLDLPPAYALALVREGVDRARERSHGVPRQYSRFKELFGEASGGPERPLVYERISPAEARLNPDWLETSALALREPELAGWRLRATEDLERRALDVLRSARSPLLVPGSSPEELAVRLLDDALASALAPAARQALRRRLEETAYVLATTDRLPSARRTLAAAVALDDPSLPPSANPLVRLLVLGGLAAVVAGETVGGRSGAEVLLDLVERQQEEPGLPPRTTQASGLILPR